ncbi:hypothetical protein GHT06_001723 [Daphnia sinensis]|uniref:Uncharacterized protein n=1 Tax=Daphnia sinensis TaxID=1820382 RepID=A0AAD5KVX8_9CRUS|nr:hypothetical protein GHT06_006671 [Daphnia sinensis]KAI9550916.1 hypothetical protein GHT06_001723 [Daphnia sinensis]
MGPSTIVQLGLAIHVGSCPLKVIVNGQKPHPLGSVEVAVEIIVMIVVTKAIVLGMKDIGLVLGNDTIKKFSQLEIQCREGKPKLWMGELPMGSTGRGGAWDAGWSIRENQNTGRVESTTLILGGGGDRTSTIGVTLLTTRTISYLEKSQGNLGGWSFG